MPFARAIIAAVLATGLVIIITLQQLQEGFVAVGLIESGAETVDGTTLDATFLLMSIAIIILVVPDAIGYFRKKQNGEHKEDQDD